jgi:hypothetical protein
MNNIENLPNNILKNQGLPIYEFDSLLCDKAREKTLHWNI